MAATWLSFNCALNVGMAPLKGAPLTVSGPVTPFRTMAATMEGGLFAHSDPAKGGNTPGRPAPLAWWQGAQIDANAAEPSTVPGSVAFTATSSAPERPSPQVDGMSTWANPI